MEEVDIPYLFLDVDDCVNVIMLIPQVGRGLVKLVTVNHSFI